MTFESLLVHLSWLITVIVTGGFAVALLRQARALRRALDAEQREHESTRIEVVGAREKLEAALSEGERVRNEFDQRQGELSARIEMLETTAEVSSEKNTALEAENAGLNAKLARLPEVTSELDGARQRFDELSRQHSNSKLH